MHHPLPGNSGDADRRGGGDPGAPPGLPRRLSLDEAAHRKGSRNLATVVSNLEDKRVHEVLDGRTRRVLERYLGSWSEADREHVEVVCIDLYEPYR